jgi:hypothetical protein
MAQDGYSIKITEEQLDSLLRQVRETGKADKRFDVNLAEGLLAEDFLVKILGKVEVKRDFKCYMTGNVAIEYRCRGDASGISSTKADWWAIFLEKMDVAILVKTDKLKKITRRYLGGERDVSGGDENASKMILVPAIELII